MNIQRNARCWCGSTKKYKQCHEKWDNRYNIMKLEGHTMPERSLIKSPEDLRLIKKAAAINNGVLDMVARRIHAGMTTEEINTLVHQYTIEHGGIPAPLNYEGFPKSVCTSLNDEVCHGIPSEEVILHEGDIVNVDVTTIYQGHYADASRMFMIGEVDADAKRLVEVAKECLQIGIDAIRPWGHVGDIGAAIMAHAHKNGYSVVRDFAGHGVGNGFHEDPIVPHIGMRGSGMVLTPGMVLTVEPMINAGSWELFIDEENGWTAYTCDGSLSAQWEHTIYISEHGVEIIAY